MNTNQIPKLDFKKETGNVRPLFSWEFFKQFISSVHITKLPVCNSASDLYLELSSAPNHPQNAYGSGKWEELSEAQASSLCSKSGPGQHIHVGISLQPHLSRNFCFGHTQSATRDDCKILQGKTTVSRCFRDSQSAYASVFGKGSPYCWNKCLGGGKGTPKDRWWENGEW